MLDRGRGGRPSTPRAGATRVPLAGPVVQVVVVSAGPSSSGTRPPPSGWDAAPRVVITFARRPGQLGLL